MKRLLKLLTNKIIITLFFFLVEVGLLAFFLLVVSQVSIWIYIALKILSIIVAIAVMSRDSNPAYKLALIIPILIFSTIGGIIYLSMGRPRTSRRKMKRLQAINTAVDSLLGETQNALQQNMHVAPDELDDPQLRRLSRFIQNDAGYPVYNETDVAYFSSGEAYYAALKEALQKAERFVFLEYFIIEPGLFWNDLSDILLEKVKAGVDVRVIYDDVGSLFTLNRKEKKRLRDGGIQLMAFNRMTPSFDIRLNNRSHRKIAVIDGSIAFTGGINLADEYINAVDRCGHWKDTGIRLTGTAAWSFTVMFLSFWSLKHDLNEDISQYVSTDTGTENVGYVQPFADKSGQNLQLTENVLLQIINSAKEYIYINTPYLILDNELASMLCLAAKSGVDVRITVPHIPDKRAVFMMTRSFYARLIEAGVKIYEYTPGFVHAKSMVSDNKVAYVGTCNLDFRSLYLHFECGAVLYGCPCIQDIRDDYLATVALSEEITLEKARGANIFVRLARSVLRIFAPLL